MPHICEPPTAQPFDKCLELYPHISGLHLADDPLNETHQMDMLIGSDFYWNFMTGEVARGADGPVAINTTLGWMLFGPADFTSPLESTVNLVTIRTLQDDAGCHNEILGNPSRVNGKQCVGLFY